MLIKEHKQKAVQAYEAFCRHYAATANQAVRATMLEFYTKLFVKELMNALMEKLSIVETRELVKLQTNLRGMLKAEAQRQRTNAEESEGATTISPVKGAQDAGRTRRASGTQLRPIAATRDSQPGRNRRAAGDND